MSYDMKKIIRDTLVDSAPMRTLLGGTTTANTPVSPTFMERSGTYPQIVFSETLGPSDPGMNATNGRIDFLIQVQATGSVNPHKKYEEILNGISGLFDDKSLSGSGAYVYHFIREGGPAANYDPKRRVITQIVGYSYKII